MFPIRGGYWWAHTQLLGAAVDRRGFLQRAVAAVVGMLLPVKATSKCVPTLEPVTANPKWATYVLTAKRHFVLFGFDPQRVPELMEGRRQP